MAIEQVAQKQGIVIAGGGTGGHLYPAVAVAQNLRKLRPDLPIDFVGTKRGLEVKIIPREGFPLHFITVGALNSVGLMTKILTLLALPFALFQSFRILRKLKPKAVWGVGGYSSGPVMVAAKLLRLPTFLFESNAVPGLTNRWLAPFVDMAFVNFEDTRKFFWKSKVVGIPVRAGLAVSIRSSHDKLRLLVFGGSQGARGINMAVTDAIKKAVAEKKPWLEKVEIVHQIGSADFAKFRAEYEKLGLKQVQCFEFLYDMPERYRWADLVICRAGASTLAELAMCRKASVLVPFPHAADDHQKKNAEVLASAGAAILVEQKDLTPEKIEEVVLKFSGDRSQLEALERNIKNFATQYSDEMIAAELLILASR